ncbi:MAG: sarcosine oxidase subunit gamma [Dongiaceae bacterium]
MVEPYLRRTPLAHRGLAAKAAAADGADIAVGEQAHCCQIDIRGEAGDAAFAGAVRSVTGLQLPSTPNSFATAGELACLWLGPDEWLIFGPGGDEHEIAGRLRAAFADLHAAVIDVSEARTAITLAGPRARELLAKGTSIDLHPRVFGPGRCVQTGFAGANIILRQTDQTPAFEILVLNSFAEHVWAWIEGACREFRVAVRGQ